MARDVWQNIRPVVPTKLINKKFTVPVFDVECGEIKTCLRLFSDGTNQGYIEEILVSPSDLSTGQTIEAWLKIDSLPTSSSGDNYAVIFERTDLINIYSLLMFDQDGKIWYEIRKGGVQETFVSSPGVIPTGEWFHIAASWDGTTVNLYVNAVLLATGSLAAPADATNPTRNVIGKGSRVSGDNFKQFRGYVDEVRIWDVGRTTDQIIDSYRTPRNKTAADGVDDDLLFYYKIQEGDGNTTVDSIGGGIATILISVNQYDWITDDGFPLRYGASFICNLITVVVGTPCSIKFPIDKPDDPNHGLFVRYQDTEGEWQRRRLYESGESYDNVDIHPFLCPSNYMGERLSETFYIEVWNVDGQATAVLEETIDVDISITSNPTSGRDHIQLVAATPTSSTVLAFSINPVVNPMVPNQTQVYT